MLFNYGIVILKACATFDLIQSLCALQGVKVMAQGFLNVTYQ